MIRINTNNNSHAIIAIGDKDMLRSGFGSNNENNVLNLQIEAMSDVCAL